MSRENKRRFYIVLFVAILALLTSGFLFVKYQEAVSNLSEDRRYIESLERKNIALQDSIDDYGSQIAERGVQVDKYKEVVVTLRDSIKSSENRLKAIQRESLKKIEEIQNSTLNERREMLTEYSVKLEPIVLQYEEDTVFAFREEGQKEMLTLFESGERSVSEVHELREVVSLKTEVIANKDSIINIQDSTITDYQKSVELYRQMVSNYDEQKGEYENLLDVKDDKISALKWKNRALWGGVTIAAGGIVYLLVSQ